MSRIAFWFVGSSSLLLMTSIAQAQMIPDGRLDTRVVSSDDRNFTITHGTSAGQNLFHSFREFSIPTAGSATFDLINTPNISTIFSRVTGSNLSSIDGTIRTLNARTPTSIFLLNPNGILFGTNARLDINGSFIATSADRIDFADGSNFSAVNPTPLLTISAPIGLQFGQNPGTIRVQGTGHTVQANTTFAPVRFSPQQGLTVPSRQTLALFGGDVVLDGGILTAPSGRIEISAIDNAGSVQLSQTANGWRSTYPSGTNYRDIRLFRRSMLDASGFGSNGIQLQGRHLTFQESSWAFIGNTGTQPAGTLQVNGSESITFDGSDRRSGSITSGLWSQTLGQGTGANIAVSTPRFAMLAGGRIISTTFSPATGGSVRITAPDSIEVDGISPFNFGNRSGTYVSTSRSGQAGSIEISTGRFTLSNGGQFFSSTFGAGNTGNVTVNATDIELKGFNFAAQQNSNIGISSLNSGNAGTLLINTQRLSVFDGAAIAGSALASGRAGNVIINATDSILASGKVLTQERLEASSNIGSSANIVPPQLGLFLGLQSPIPTGNAGTVEINTPLLRVNDGASIQVRNQGSGDGGGLSINARAIQLENHGKILADTKSGEGGNIRLQSSIIHLQNDSEISSTAGGLGDGGNIDIAAQFIIQRGNSDITANAIEGRGGNIQISAQGLLGGKFRDRATPNSDITASSKFGLNGAVTITTFGVDPNSGLIALSTDLIDTNQHVAQGCTPNTTSQFIITGRGGTPQNPTEQMLSGRVWVDLRAVRPSAIVESPQTHPALIEATTWKRDEGKIKLIAPIAVSNAAIATCTLSQ